MDNWFLRLLSTFLKFIIANNWFPEWLRAFLKYICLLIATFVCIGVVSGLAIVSTRVLYALNIFSQSDPRAEQLEFIGVLLTTVISASLVFIASIFAWYLKGRELRLREETETRLASEAEESQKRLTSEAGTKAIALLSHDGKPTPPDQQSGALAMLASLGPLDVSLALLRRMWPEDIVVNATAVWLIDKALVSTSQKAKIAAADLLVENVHRVITPSGYILWPHCITHDWNSELLDTYLRRRLFVAILNLLLAKPRLRWHDNHLDFVLYLLYLILCKEPAETHIRKDCAFATEFFMDEVIKFKDGDKLVLGKIIKRDEIDDLIKDIKREKLPNGSTDFSKEFKMYNEYLKMWNSYTWDTLGFDKGTITLNGYPVSTSSFLEFYDIGEAKWVDGRLRREGWKHVFEVKNGGECIPDISEIYIRFRNGLRPNEFAHMPVEPAP